MDVSRARVHDCGSGELMAFAAATWADVDGISSPACERKLLKRDCHADF
ncbi:MAG: hypothetical protein KAS72_06805 [Phycisphaerales bacterium]|nr:hypothetical protein [Phycisphaerales bacterium]